MIEDVIRDPERAQLPIEELSSPLSAQLLEYCEAELLGSEIVQSSETTSSSNRCYEDNTFNNHVCLPPDTKNVNSFQDNNGSGNVNSTALMTTPSTSNNISTNIAQNGSSNFSTLFDDSPVDEVDDISASIDFSTSPPFYVPPFSGAAPQEHQFDFSPPQSQIPLTDHVVNGIISPYTPPSTNQTGGMLCPALPPIVEDCLSSVPYYPLSRPSPSCTFLGPNNCGGYSPMPGNLNGPLCGDTSGMFMGSLLELQAPELDFRGDSAGMYYPNPNQQILINPGDIQALDIESQKLLNGPASSSSPLATEVSNFEDSAYKVGKLSIEERKEKIHRYMKKRNERNFSKKIKYACRKTLADSRPRVRGRFAKNDELGEASRPSSSNHDDDDDDEHVAVKEEEEVMDSSDIFAHISGLNSFKCNYPIQPWIGPTSGY